MAKVITALGILAAVIVGSAVCSMVLHLLVAAGAQLPR